MRWLGLLILLLASLGAIAGEDETIGAGPAGDAVDWQVRYKKELDVERTFELVETPLDQALEFIGGLAKINAYLDPRIDDVPVATIKCEKKSIQQTLPAVLEKFGLAMVLRDEALLVLPKGAAEQGGAAADELTAEQKKSLADAIKDLGAETFEVREKATAAIVKLGPAAAGTIEATAKESKDIQIKMKARALLKQLKVLNLTAEKPDAKVDEALAKLDTPLTLEFFDVLLPQALEIINDALKTRKQPPVVVEFDEKLQQARVTLIVRTMQTGNILRWLARHGGAKITINGDKLTLVPPK